MIALNFDALGGNNYSHLDTSSFCLYIDRRDNETHLPSVNEPIRLPLRSPSFCLYKFLPLYTCATPFILLSYSIVTFDLSSRSYLPFHSHRYIVDSREVKPRGGALFPKVFLNFQKEGEIYGNRIFPPWFVSMSPVSRKKHFTTGVVTLGIELPLFS